MKNINRNLKKPTLSVTPVPIALDDPLIDGLVDEANYPGLISRDASDAPFLQIDIPLSTWVPTPMNPARADVLDLHFDDIGNFESGLVVSEPVFFSTPLPMFYSTRIPRRLLTEGLHHVSYKITSGGPGGNPSGSRQLPLVVDRTAPYDSVPYVPRALTLPAGWPGSLTETFLASHDAGGGVPFGIPDYAAEGADSSDFWRLSYAGSNVIIAQGPVFPDRVVRYSRALAEAAEGPRKLEYRLVDVAGNVSDASFELPISVALTPAPVLTACGVRDAVSVTGVGDRLIDRPDTAKSFGMLVIIPTYAADRTADEFIVHLTTTHGTRDVGPLPLGGAPLPFDFHVGYSVLAALYGTSIGPISLTVEYTVRRHGVPHKVPTATVINLDLFEGGPDYPEKPDPINTNLLLPVLTGKGSGKTNELDDTDNGLDADVVVELWSDPPLPSARDFTIHLYYMHELVDSRSVVAATAMPGDEISMRVPWPYIQRHSNATIPLHYQIEVAGTNNRATSGPQSINVNANIIALQKPTVLGALPEVPGTPPLPGEIRCGALLAPQRFARVAVPPDPELMKRGMIITVYWTACSDDDGTMPIASATDTFPYGPLTPQEEQLGFTVPIGPYDTYIKPINKANHSMGSVVIKYNVPIIGTGPTDSPEALYLVRGVSAGPVYCDGTPWPGA
ncbi:hypothetical protein PSH77_12835 [Pseudomonas extremorientalis]|uniref:hypothetical protein n=1 Tax=Pseudomonas extremorientalis TaxID=169669 RepID=UPI0027353990|nr:hypothetical protein [Pseudomonas extremorientalis]WLG59374.1 hypothetical protein PSH77_12835 [Pseudomonas extremorientalis]